MVLNLPKDKLILNFSHAEPVEALVLQRLKPEDSRVCLRFVASIHFVHTFDKLSRTKCGADDKCITAVTRRWGFLALNLIKSTEGELSTSLS